MCVLQEEEEKKIFMNNSHFIMFLSLCSLLFSVVRMRWQCYDTRLDREIAFYNDRTYYSYHIV